VIGLITEAGRAWGVGSEAIERLGVGVSESIFTIIAHCDRSESGGSALPCDQSQAALRCIDLITPPKLLATDDLVETDRRPLGDVGLIAGGRWFRWLWGRSRANAP